MLFTNPLELESFEWSSSQKKSKLYGITKLAKKDATEKVFILPPSVRRKVKGLSELIFASWDIF